MKSQRGMALITSLMLLAFLTIVGGALLSSTTVDMRIGMNYRTNAQLLFVTEAGIEAARETLEVLEAHKSIVARRSNKAIKNFTEEDWKKLHSYIKKVFG